MVTLPDPAAGAIAKKAPAATITALRKAAWKRPASAKAREAGTSKRKKMWAELYGDFPEAKK